MRALELVQTHIESPLVFLLVLNVFLLIVGGLMDIYSAIFVIVPLVGPIGLAYGIDPAHLASFFWPISSWATSHRRWARTCSCRPTVSTNR